MKKAGTLIIVLWLATLHIKSFAQDIDLEKIVVTPSRIEEDYTRSSRKVEVITAKDILNSGAQDVATAITSLSPVNISNYGGLGAQKNIRMRGSSAAQVLVLVDGRPINSPRDGTADLSVIPVENIDRIELVHGPSSSLYGAGAMGGTLNIITKGPPKEKQKTEFTTTFGTFRTYIEQLTYGGKVSKLGYIATGEYETSEGYRDNSNFYAKSSNIKLEYSLNDINKLKIDSGFYTSKVGAPGLITSIDTDDKQVTLKKFLDIGWGLKPDALTDISAKVYETYDRLEFIENTAGSIFDTALAKDIHTTKVTGLDLQFSKQITERYQGICGFNYVKNTNDSTTSAKHRYTVRAGYVENRISLLDNLKITAGVRADNYSNFGNEISPSFTCVYNLTPDTKLRGSISESFRAPTFNDLYWPDQGWTAGNPSLKPENGETTELGLDSKINKYIHSSITYYRNDYSGLINWVEEAGVWKPKNIGSAIIDGIELENKIDFNDNLEMRLGYTFLKAKDEASNSYLIYQPKHKADSSLKYSGPGGITLELKGQFTDTRFHDANNTIKIKRFFLLGINASKKIGDNLTCFIYIDNLLDKKYQVIRDYPMPGFSLNARIKLEF